MSDLQPSCAAVADACYRQGIAVAAGQPGLLPIHPATRVCGPLLPLRGYLELRELVTMHPEQARGHVLYVDDGGNRRRAVVGDQTILHAARAGALGIVVWGSHRDTSQLLEIEFPVFSLGACPLHPESRSDPSGHLSARAFDEYEPRPGDLLVGDADGVVVVPADSTESVLQLARVIEAREAEERLLEHRPSEGV